MKKVIFAIAVLTMCIRAGAQVMNHSKWEENSSSNDKVKIAQDNEFAVTEMDENNRIITFSDLPVMPSSVRAIITDAYGNVMSQKKVSPLCNTMDIHKLSEGELYFVTLVYKSRSQKAFVLKPH